MPLANARRVIGRIARDAVYDFLEAAEGEAGTQVAVDPRPDIIVLDLLAERADVA